MSTFDQASLVMIPSGYKTSKVYSIKPTDGSGDLAFSRSNDTATRVNSAGLIEKVRTNLALYSEDFTNAVWNKYNNATATANSTTAPNGTTTADTYGLSTASTTFPNIAQDFNASNGVEYAFSVYAKKNVTNFIKLRVGGTAFSASTNSPIFNLNTGTVVSGTGTIESVGNGWYRCSFYETAGATATGGFALDLPDANGVWSGSSVYTASDSVFIWGFQTQTGPVATDYIATTSAAVSVGPVANVPRLDYLNSSCPRLLLEPQRTNLVTYSEQFDNAIWGSFQSASVTANTTISPDGYQNADTITFSSDPSSLIFQNYTSTSNTFTISVYAKSSTGKKFCFRNFDGVGVVRSSDFTTTSSWQRFSFTFTSALSNVSICNEVGGGVGAIQVYGCQLEQASYATSYIPTLGSASTRGKDSCLTASVPSLIGQTEGTMFIEFERKSLAADSFFILSNVAGTTSNSYLNSIYIYQLASSTIVVEGYISNVQQFGFTTSALSVGTHKVAIAYKANDFALYIDGVQIGTDTSGNVTAMNFLTIGGGADVANHTQAVSQALLFKTRLTNSQLAELTSL